MKITSIEAHPVVVPIRSDLAIVGHLGKHDISSYAVVAVHAEEGLVGFGEANVMPIWSGESQASALAAIREILTPLLIGRDPLHLGALAEAMDRVLVDNPFTKAALEIALIDLAGRILDVPANVLLGGPRRSPEIPLRFSIGAFSPKEAARVAESVRAMGFRAVKVKVGLGVPQDIARVEAVRSALGDGVPVGVDANTGWSERETVAAIPHLERLGVNVIEEPIARGNFGACARLRQRTSIPIMLDESVFTLQDALEAIRSNACDLISIYPGKNGGMSRSLEIAHMAAAAGMECVIGSNMEFEIGTAAMLHVAVAIPNLAKTVNHDIIGTVYHTRRIAVDPIRIENGCAIVPVGAGLGVNVNVKELVGESHASATGQ